MSANYRVDIAIGPTTAGVTYTWSINKGDPPSLPDVLDGLTFGWQFADSNLWPIQPDPVTASLSLIAADAADLEGIDRGTPILIRVWAGVVVDAVQEDSVTFLGRITDPAGRSIKFGHPDTGEEVDGWLLELQCVDLVPDLGEQILTGFYEPLGAMQDSIANYFALAGVTPPDWGDGGNYGLMYVVNDGFIEPTDLLSFIDGILACYADAGVLDDFGYPDQAEGYVLYASQGFRRGIVRPNLDPVLVDEVDAAVPWRIEWVSRRHGTVPSLGTPSLPAVFAPVGGGFYGLQLGVPPVGVDDASIVIDADYLSYDATWTRSKFDDPNTVTVANSRQDTPWISVEASNRLPNEPVVAAVITDSPTPQREAEFVASMYLDDSTNAAVIWSASGFRWYASRDPQWPVKRSLFPEARTFGQYAAPIVITGIPANQRPDDRPWYVGVPRSVTWTFERGEFDISFDLYPRIPRPIVEENVGLTWNDLASDFATVDWNDLDPSLAWVEYRLARTTFYT